ncbi:MAG: hypothetical protein EKK49_21540 [Rhodocyclaceae bacterium]|nr:MAG: hypothetical protein EKK49_21540 [Rhodocyclaceae bacterium]
MRTNLKVPFAEKDEAKRLGARWDPANKTWYVKDVEDLAAFARWLPAPGEAAAAPAAKPSTRSKPATASATVKVGANYFELACDCPPWEGCPKCQAIVAAKDW